MKKHFTLIELLVVIAIIAILAAMLLPLFMDGHVDARKVYGLNYNSSPEMQLFSQGTL